MRNQDNVLPLESGKKISLFGIGSAKFVYSGLGSGAIDTSKTTSLKDALEAEGFQVNPDLYSVYEKSEARVGKEDVYKRQVHGHWNPVITTLQSEMVHMKH